MSQMSWLETFLAFYQHGQHLSNLEHVYGEFII
jgi:hypothetical protein